MLSEIVKWYLVIINALTFLLFVIDKVKAIRGSWRISEKTLIGFSAIGGTIGALSGMYTVRHKTKKPLFKFGIPVILILQITTVLYLRGLI